MQNTQEELYSVLGISKTASERDIKKVYRKLANKFHPDKNPGNEAAEKRFQKINAAYEVLSDPDKRKLYDEFGAISLQSGFDAEQARRYQQRFGGTGGNPFGDLFSEGGTSQNLSDVFGMFFGNQARGGFHRPRQGENLQATATVDFLTALKGGNTTLSVHGQKLEVTLAQGLKSGQKIRLSGKGQASPNGGPAGDLIIELTVAKHPRYRREDQDIHLDLPVTLLELFNGASISVKTPDGSIELDVPPRSQNHRKLRLRGLGVPDSQGQRGNLYIHLIAKMPETDDPKAEKQIQELLQSLDKHYKKPIREQ